ncbi:MAG: DNA translocase FtsK [Lachnospiraceae bacterium]|nr:DNA translocase FtsK [Lachnospiraceae bacterium]
MTAELIAGRIREMSHYSLPEIYMECGSKRNGGGVIAGSLAYASYKGLSIAGTVIVLIALFIVCLVLITGRSFIKSLKRGGRFMADRTTDTVRDMRERDRIRREENRKRKLELQEKERLAIEMKNDEQVLKRGAKSIGVPLLKSVGEETDERKDEGDAFVPGADPVRDDVHEITVRRYSEEHIREEDRDFASAADADDPFSIRGEIREIKSRTGTGRVLPEPPEPEYEEEETEDIAEEEEEEEYIPAKPQSSFKDEEKHLQEVITPGRTSAPEPASPAKSRPHASPEPAKKPAKVQNKKYVFPPVDLLKKSDKQRADSDAELMNTGHKLEEILSTFGVNARVTEVSQGPTVTRFELQPEAGVKVSKILNLTDDIKLNLAATDIRIEAPIPGKAAVGIEVPNKNVATVFFRDVVDTQDFRAAKSKLSIGVGKDLAGKPVISDIAKMPHVLIAGSTGSGKSVCINTIIMSILYKAAPEDVKLIMIDPKVVELSVYNGIPHLLIPVVTEPAKAAAALNWAVAEMTKRYKMFADARVRDIKGYNAWAEQQPEGERPEKMPQILVIVDELADLMMTCANDVESAIVRLTQLARAAGIHLVIATQRPSVDVITGLIKANMPSRIAFAVTSNTDSRTILDMVGAERLLGKGDMLFFPQGQTRPSRVQGAFVSDDEVADVTAFIRDQGYQLAGADMTTDEIEQFSTGSSQPSGDQGSSNERDAFFEDAARLIIGKDKASISMLQRVFKVGFNRSARIMDQLCEAGVVSEDEGTKPRRVLMSEAEFDAWLENNRE